MGPNRHVIIDGSKLMGSYRQNGPNWSKLIKYGPTSTKNLSKRGLAQPDPLV